MSGKVADLIKEADAMKNHQGGGTGYIDMRFRTVNDVIEIRVDAMMSSDMLEAGLIKMVDEMAVRLDMTTLGYLTYITAKLMLNPEDSDDEGDK